MTLLWITIACLVGVWTGGLLLNLPWAQSLPALACGLPAWLWLPVAALLPVTPLLNRLRKPPQTPLTWSGAAGFRAPRRWPSPALLAALLLALAAGLLRSLGAPAERCWNEGDLAFYNVPAELAFDRTQPAFALYGTLSRYVPDATGRVRLTVAATARESDEGLEPLAGGLTLQIDGSQALAQGLQYGSPVRVWGTPSTPPVFSGFSYRDYLARHGVHSQMALAALSPVAGEPGGNPLLRRLYQVRKAGERLLNRALPEPWAALANGMLLGIDANIDDATQTAFNDTSASHVLVISGSNVALLSGLLFATGSRLFKRRTAAAVTLAAITLYTLLVGGEPSVLRAAVMGSLVVVAVALGRRSTALVSLAAAALLMVLADPHVLHDVGFQLSAAATAGLVLLPPLLPGGRALGSDRIAGEGLISAVAPGVQAQSALRTLWVTLRDVLVITLAASLAVQPLLLYHFQRLSVVGLLTNLLIVPVQPLILTLGSAGLLLGLLGGLVGLSLVALPLLWAAWLGLAWTLAVVEATAQARWASLAIPGYGAAAMAATYAVLGLLVWQVQRAPQAPAQPATRAGALARLLTAPAVSALLLLAALLLWVGVAQLPTGRLTVRAVEADRGDALIVTLPNGGQLLVDGGGDSAQTLTQLGGALPLWDRTLELALLSVDDAQTAAAQSGLGARLRVGSAAASVGPGDAGDLWARAMVEGGVEPLALAPGGWLDLGDGVSLWALPATAATGGGEPFALKLVYGDFALLLPGSAAAPSAAEVAANPALYAATVLAAPDIRDGDTRATAWMAAAQPKLLLLWEETTPVFPPGLAPTVHAPAAHGTLTITSDGSTWQATPQR